MMPSLMVLLRNNGFSQFQMQRSMFGLRIDWPKQLPSLRQLPYPGPEHWKRSDLHRVVSHFFSLRRRGGECVPTLSQGVSRRVRRAGVDRLHQVPQFLRCAGLRGYLKWRRWEQVSAAIMVSVSWWRLGSGRFMSVYILQ